MSDAKPFSRILPHFSQGRFNNYRNQGSEDSLWRSVVMYMHAFLARRKYDQRVVNEWYQPTRAVTQSDEPRIFWLGHSSFLIQIGGKNILTDPVFGNLTFLFPRILPVGITLSALPVIDYVLISHNHRDHMDEPSLLQLKKKFNSMHILVPQGDKHWFDRRGFSLVTEYMWWDRLETSDFTFSFLPAFHWSQRGFFDRNKSLWGSWMIANNNFFIYFAGDTAYADHFKRIAYYFPRIDVALLPIGPCEPRLWMRRSHVDADEAGQSFLDLGALNFIPMHWGTFYFGTDEFLNPVNRLNSWWTRNVHLLHTKNVQILKIGESANFTRISRVSAVHGEKILKP